MNVRRLPGQLVLSAVAAALAFGVWTLPGRAEERAPKSDAKPDAGRNDSQTKTEAKEPKSEVPSPAELMKRLKEERDRKSKLSKIAHFDLSEQVKEAPSGFSLFGDDRLVLRTLVDRIQSAAVDKNVKGMLLTLNDSGLGLSQAQEVRDSLISFRKSGKPVFVYADSYDTVSYTLASGASDICMLEGGEIMMPGVGLESMFAKGLLDKVGVKADYVQIGEFKGADEEMTRTEASPELRGEMTKLAEGLYDQIIDGIASSRKIPKEVVKQTIDETVLQGKTAKTRGFVDHLIDQDGLRDLMAKKMGNDVDLMKDYGKEKREALDFSSPLAAIQSLMKQPEAPENPKPAVALVYAQGVIQDGEVDSLGLFGDGGVGSENMRVAMRIAARDDNIKAIVIRIDSPGGSALASEVMWQAVRRAAAKKPVFISIGGMAASGGYYLAVAGDKIYADPTAIVGSIGVVGGKMVFKDLFEKVGLHTETFSKGRNAGMWSSSEPWTDKQRELVRSWMKQTYEQFTDRVSAGRKGKIQDIDKVARGRIFVAKQAKELGMVDEIGGINEAIADAAKKVGLKAGDYNVQVVPRPKTLADFLNGTADDKGTGPQAQLPIRVDVKMDNEFTAALKALPPGVRSQLGRQIATIRLFNDRPVALVAPYSVKLK